MTLLADLARWYTSVASLWLLCVLLRIAYMRVKANGWTGRQMPHPVMALGVAILLLIVVSRRMEDLGEPGDRYVWLATIAVTLIGYGILQTVTLPLVPPFLRREFLRRFIASQRDTSGVHRAH